MPPEISTHKSPKKKKDRCVLKGHSLAIKKRIEKIVPVGSGKEEKQTLSKLNSSFVKSISTVASVFQAGFYLSF